MMDGWIGRDMDEWLVGLIEIGDMDDWLVGWKVR